MEPRRVALAVENERQFAHQLEALHQRRVAAAQPGIAFEQQVHVRVGHALYAADHAGGELLPDDVALAVDFKQTRRAPAGPPSG